MLAELKPAVAGADIKPIYPRISIWSRFLSLVAFRFSWSHEVRGEGARKSKPWLHLGHPGLRCMEFFLSLAAPFIFSVSSTFLLFFVKAIIFLKMFSCQIRMVMDVEHENGPKTLA
jgi:hypothetical protein